MQFCLRLVQGELHMKDFNLRLKRSAMFMAAAAAVFSASGAALAAGTNAGASVSNHFTLDYQVGGISQTQIDTSSKASTRLKAMSGLNS